MASLAENSQAEQLSGVPDFHTPTLAFIKHFPSRQHQKLSILSNLIITLKHPQHKAGKKKLKMIKFLLDKTRGMMGFPLLQSSFEFCTALCSWKTLITLPPGRGSFAITAALPNSSSASNFLCRLWFSFHFGLSSISSYDYI